jgi:flagellin
MALTISMSNFNSAARYMNRNTRALSKSFARISSGKRITNASDDAAGLGVASNLDAKARSVKQGIRNANDGISIIQTAEGAYQETQNIFQRMRELAVQSSSDTLASTERAYVQDEYASLSSEIERIANVTEFNGINLTDGSTGGTLSVQVGPDSDSNNRIDITLGNLNGTNTLLARNPFSTVSTTANARTTITIIDKAIDELNGYRSDMGSSQNRMDYAINAAEIYAENLTSAQSRIEDLDYAHESAQMAKQQIIQQAGIAVMMQMRQMDKSILSLL